MALVSVVIPLYNAADSIEQTVRSALDQTHDNIEVIVVDDASQDDGPDIVQQMDDSRISLLQHARNRGGAAARNTGIKEAEGEYIAFLDSDDRWHEAKIERQLERIHGTEFVGSYTRVGIEGASPSALERVYHFIRSEDDRLESGGEDLIPAVFLMDIPIYGGSTLLVKSEVVDEIDGFDPSFPRHQDWEFLVKVLKNGKIACVDEELVTIRASGHPESETLATAKELFLNKFRDTVEDLEFRGHPIRGAHAAHLAESYAREGRYGDAARTLVSTPPKRLKDYGRVVQAIRE